MTIHTLNNSNGIKIRIMPLGGIIKELWVPDREGNLADVTLGFDTEEEYLDNAPYFGAIIGRVGNRIGKSTFKLNGADYRLAENDGANHLHGGNVGFNKVNWEIEPIHDNGNSGLRLSYTSVDGEEGYPGNLTTEVCYCLSEDNELRIRYRATTDAPTPVNLTQHAYFNLAGHDSGQVLDHQVMINADFFTPADEFSIPTGEIRRLDNTPLDFRKPAAIGERIEQDFEQLRLAKGLDHNFVLNKVPSELSHAATVSEPNSGRKMDVFTTEPGIQLYTGNYLDEVPGKQGAVYPRRGGLCLETQHFPDAPNKPMFPSVILLPGIELRSETIYRFGIC
ncbi:MAG: galactose mutarotase [Verrucomicrobiae bacterium]|nr:galactose mutarotase [Verrucomicrobiae bacterium]